MKLTINAFCPCRLNVWLHFKAQRVCTYAGAQNTASCFDSVDHTDRWELSMSLFAVDTVAVVASDSRTPQRSDCLERGPMSEIRRARWSFAVLDELADVGDIALSTVVRSDGSIDFVVTSVSPAAAGCLREFPQSVIGRRLVDVFPIDCEAVSLHAICIEVAETGASKSRISTQCSAIRGGSVFICIARTLTGIGLSLFSPDAQESRLRAHQTLQVLEAEYASRGVQRSDRALRFPTLFLPTAQTWNDSESPRPEG